MCMKLICKLAIALLSALAIANANAVIINFQDMAKTDGTAYGESIWSTLTITDPSFTLNITGTNSAGPAYAYLDSISGGYAAGLGVCGTPTDINKINTKYPNSGTNLCNPSDDDNVTTGEALHFTFNTNVIIDTIWFNDNHDSDFNLNGNQIVIGGSNYLFSNGGVHQDSYTLSPYNVSASHTFDIAFYDDQFYISKIDVRAVPEPATLALMGIGLIGLGFSRRKRTH